jgi:hypothetical protein
MYVDQVEAGFTVGTADGVGPLQYTVEAHAAAEAHIWLSICCDAAWVTWPPLGSRYAQAVYAAWNCELLTPSSSRLVLGIAPLLVGSGNLGTPCERMQRA